VAGAAAAGGPGGGEAAGVLDGLDHDHGGGQGGVSSGFPSCCGLLRGVGLEDVRNRLPLGDVHEAQQAG
jgi:hypothetical protein